MWVAGCRACRISEHESCCQAGWLGGCEVYVWRLHEGFCGLHDIRHTATCLTCACSTACQPLLASPDLVTLPPTQTPHRASPRNSSGSCTRCSTFRTGGWTACTSLVLPDRFPRCLACFSSSRLAPALMSRQYRPTCPSPSTSTASWAQLDSATYLWGCRVRFGVLVCFGILQCVSQALSMCARLDA